MKSMMAVCGIVASLLGSVNLAKEELNIDSKESFPVGAETHSKPETKESVPTELKDDFTSPARSLFSDNLTDVDKSVYDKDENVSSGVRRNNVDADDGNVIYSMASDDRVTKNFTDYSSEKKEAEVDEEQMDSFNGTVKNSSLDSKMNATTNGTIEETVIDSNWNDSSTVNDTSLVASTSSPTATPSPFVYVDPREFQTDDLDNACPLRRRAKEADSASLSSPSSSISCSSLPAPCFNCTYEYNCTYGARTTATCTTDVDCRGEKTILRNITCQYCFQTKFGEEHVCTLRNGPGDGVNPGCHVKKSPSSQSRFKSNCTVRPHVYCLGRRSFHKMLPCNWTSGYRWTTSLILSIFLGGFGADRFYLGQWREGIGKLFSFGGLGVWTVIDVILISIGYIGPHDGSLYIY